MYELYVYEDLMAGGEETWKVSARARALLLPTNIQPSES